jgi:hypothetical protein
MAQFIAFLPDVEVNGQSILDFLNAFSPDRQIQKIILANHGLMNIKPDEWYLQTEYLKVLKYIA